MREREREITRERREERVSGERGETVGLVTRCVLLLLYGGLLHHQNIKCPAGKRAYAWVHPHFTFTADCRLNRATFPRFLAPENALIRSSRILSPSLSFFLRTPARARAFAITGSLLSLLFHLPARLTPFLISRILFATSRPVSFQKFHSFFLHFSVPSQSQSRRHALFGSLYSAITLTSRIAVSIGFGTALRARAESDSILPSK